jgi:hypothetical protein
MERDQARAEEGDRDCQECQHPSRTQSGERQPRVVPTASTMVNASTHSTMLAINAGTAAIAAVSTVLRLYIVAAMSVSRSHGFVGGGSSSTAGLQDAYRLLRPP